MIGLNPKQKKLIDDLRNTTNYTTEANIYSQVKHKMLKEEDIIDSSIRNEVCQSNLNILSVTDINPKDKVTSKFCRDKFSFVPKQITSYAKFIKGIIPYQTRSIMIHFNFTQDSDTDKDIYRFEVKTGPQKNIAIEEASGGVIWLTFYDDDTRLLIYEFHPSVYSRHRQTDTDQPMEIIRYKPKIKRITRVGSRAIQHRIPIDGLTGLSTELKNKHLDIENINGYRYKSINNLQQSMVGYFNEALV